MAYVTYAIRTLPYECSCDKNFPRAMDQMRACELLTVSQQAPAERDSRQGCLSDASFKQCIFPPTRKALALELRDYYGR